MTAPRLLDQVRVAIRRRHLSPRTEAAYVSWIRRFVRFHGLQHPRDLGHDEVTTYLTPLEFPGALQSEIDESAPKSAPAV